MWLSSAIFRSTLALPLLVRQNCRCICALDDRALAAVCFLHLPGHRLTVLHTGLFLAVCLLWNYEEVLRRLEVWDTSLFARILPAAAPHVLSLGRCHIIIQAQLPCALFPPLMLSSDVLT